MKKWTLAIGLVILITGLAFVSFSTKPKTEISSSYKQKENVWSISDNFIKGQNMTLNFQPHMDWSLDQYDVFDDPPYHRKYLWVNVTDTVAKTCSLYIITLVYPHGYIPSSTGYSYRLELYPPVNVYQHGALEVEDHPDIDSQRGINLGITPNNGTYIVSASLDPPTVLDKDLNGTLWVHDASPLPVIALYKVSTTTNYPYTPLLPIGASFAVIGTVLPVLSLKSSKPKTKRRETAR